MLCNLRAAGTALAEELRQDGPRLKPVRERLYTSPAATQPQHNSRATSLRFGQARERMAPRSYFCEADEATALGCRLSVNIRGTSPGACLYRQMLFSGSSG